MAQPQVNQVYPNTYTLTPPFSSSTTSNSNPNNSVASGSFRSVFVVLAIVVAISAIACLFGRICNGRKKREKGAKEPKKGKDEHRKVTPIGPKEWESRQKPSFRDGEIEFGFDNKRMMPPSSNNSNNKNKVVHQGVPRGPKPYLQHG
ncbi:hypothetical protein DM860_017321 [Cuscuta australis]|nr:hypothetical protein DM860_017321 [Cuscuta australis]